MLNYNNVPYIAEIALDNVCTAGVLGQCATVNAECQVDAENPTKCLCKSTHLDKQDAYICQHCIGSDLEIKFIKQLIVSL
jgi:hypothetical protein